MEEFAYSLNSSFDEIVDKLGDKKELVSIIFSKGVFCSIIDFNHRNELTEIQKYLMRVFSEQYDIYNYEPIRRLYLYSKSEYNKIQTLDLNYISTSNKGKNEKRFINVPLKILVMNLLILFQRVISEKENPMQEISDATIMLKELLAERREVRKLNNLLLKTRIEELKKNIAKDIDFCLNQVRALKLSKRAFEDSLEIMNEQIEKCVELNIVIKTINQAV